MAKAIDLDAMVRQVSEEVSAEDVEAARTSVTSLVDEVRLKGARREAHDVFNNRMFAASPDASETL
jgi:hypothetical protein